MSELSQSLVDAATEAIHALRCGCGGPVSDAHEHIEAGEAAVAAVLETLAAHYHERAAKRAEAGGDSPQCDGDCGNDDCHMTSAVAAWQMAAAVATRAVADLRGSATDARSGA